MRTSFLIAGCLLAAGCGVPQADGEALFDPEAVRSEIVGGVTDTGDPAVVAMVVGGGGQYQEYCTGTLVAPKTVLTAAHCINAYGTQYPYFANFGTYASSPTQSVRIVAQYKHPLYNQTNGLAHDFGVVQLATAVTNVTPIEMNATALTQADVGRAIRHAGFGVTSGAGGGGGIKRQVSYTVRQITQNLIESGASGKQTCSGDSGGPAFMVMPGSTVEKLVGVVSFGDQDCNMYGEDGRVDADLAWIKQTMNPWEAPTCATDGKCVAGCTPIDQDCACVADNVCNPDCADLLKDPDCPKDCVSNGICAVDACPRPDLDCVAEGGTCTSEAQCKGRACVSDDQHASQRYCSVPCTPNSTVCPTGMECTSQLVCQLKQKPVVQPGERCFVEESFCNSGTICSGPAGGFTRCVQSCVVQGDCPTGSTCEGGSGGERYCRPPESEVRFSDIVLERAKTEGFAAPTGCASAGFGDLSVLGALLGCASLLRRRRA